MPSTGKAAYLVASGVRPLEVREAPYTAPGQNELLIRARAAAMNPVDAGKQALGNNMMPWVQYPFILGDDVAGEVVEIGLGVSRFKPGDRVLGHAVSIDKRSNRSCEGAFQEFVILRERLTSPIPDTMSFESACVLPLCLSTASCGLFGKDQLALALPRSDSTVATGETLLIWGGSTSVGCNAIQLAVAAGYDVFTTASPKNFDYVTKLGASKVFDYRSTTAISDITTALKGRKMAGAFAIGEGSLESCIEIVGASEGRKFIAQASVPAPKELPPQGLVLLSFLMTFLWFNVSTFVKSKIKGIGSKFIWGSDVIENELGPIIYENYLPRALRNGRHVPAPEAHVIGEGLESIQGALDIVVQGVSARKIVVKL